MRCLIEGRHWPDKRQGARRPEGMPGPCVLALGGYFSAARAASTPAMGEPRPVTVS